MLEITVKGKKKTVGLIEYITYNDIINQLDILYYAKDCAIKDGDIAILNSIECRISKLNKELLQL